MFIALKLQNSFYFNPWFSNHHDALKCFLQGLRYPGLDLPARMQQWKVRAATATKMLTVHRPRSPQPPEVTFPAGPKLALIYQILGCLVCALSTADGELHVLPLSWNVLWHRHGDDRRGDKSRRDVLLFFLFQQLLANIKKPHLLGKVKYFFKY